MTRGVPPRVAVARAAGTGTGEVETPDAAPARPPERFFGVRPGRAAIEAALVALASLAWCAWLYRLWDASARVPIYQDRSDARIIANLVQNTVNGGWYQHGPNLGAPFGQTLYDFPHGGETWQLVVIKFLSLFTSDYGLIMNLYFVGGFAVTAAVTFLVLRHLRFGFVAASITSIVYVFLPFHFYHEQSHLFRSSYFYAPIACAVLVWAMQWRERFLADPLPPAQPTWIKGLGWNVRHNLRWKRVIGIVAVCVLLAGTETMTTSFTMVLLAVTGVLGAIRHREPARLLVNGLLAALLGVTFLTLLYPTLNYVRTYGANEVAARRDVADQERYGLKISRMVLPSVDHQQRQLRELGYKATKSSAIQSEGGQALTMLGTVGFLGALGWILLWGWGRLPAGMRRDTRPPWDRHALLDDGALVVVVATLFGTVAGFAMVLSTIGFSQVRVWNRIVILIAFFSLIFTADWFERLGRWFLGKVERPMPFLLVLVVGVAAFGLWDGGRPAVRDYPAMAKDFASDKAFVADIEQRVPAGTKVWQLPVIPFPEYPPPGTMLDYDQMRPYLQSDGSTSWSYGAVRGRPNADWQLRWNLTADPMTLLPALAGMGFTGIWVDTAGYPDGGKAIDAQLTETLGVQPLVSANGRQRYYDMRPYIAELDMTPAQLRAQAEAAFGIEPPTGAS